MSHKQSQQTATAPPVHLAPVSSALSTVDAVFNTAIGVDIALDSLDCCFQWFDLQANQSNNEFATFPTSQSGLRHFAQWVVQRSPQIVLMESTGIFWIAPWDVLEELQLPQTKLYLVNARDVKAVKGRKTDQTDAQRLATMARMDACRPSFVPNKKVREMRLIGREYARAAKGLQQSKQRYQKLLAACGCRVSAVFSDVNGKAADAILSGYLESDAAFEDALLCHAKRLRRANTDQIRDHLQMTVSDSLRELARRLRGEMRQAEQDMVFRLRLLQKLQQDWQPWVDRLLSIPGIKEVSARLIVAEIGIDLSSFPNLQSFASWIGLCPGNNISAGKRMGKSIPKGNPYLRRVLTEIGQGIGLMKKGKLQECFQVFKEHKGRKRAVIAIAHKIVRIIFALWRDQTMFCAEMLKADVLQEHRLEQLRRAVRNLSDTDLVAVGDVRIVNKYNGEILASTT